MKTMIVSMMLVLGMTLAFAPSAHAECSPEPDAGLGPNQGQNNLTVYSVDLFSDPQDGVYLERDEFGGFWAFVFIPEECREIG